MGLIQEEADRLRLDIDGLYDDWFIETCAEWVVPYIGDLLGVRNLHSIRSAGIFSQRAYVANTLRLRRQKGTAPVLEQLARDVTGWPARAVEFFERLLTSQHINHIRPHSPATPDLSRANELEMVGGPFETLLHSAEVRRIASGKGRYNIPNIGIYLWLLQSYFLTRVTPYPATDPPDSRYFLSPLGNDFPLFNRPVTEIQISHLAGEVNVPGRLRRRALFDALEGYRKDLINGKNPSVPDYFGDQPVIKVYFDDQDEAIPPEEILICDLSGWDAPGWQAPDSVSFVRSDGTAFDTRISIDPELGRLAVLNGIALPTTLHVSYAFGFGADIGGGPYSREDILTTSTSLEIWTRTVNQFDSTADFVTISAALADWTSSNATEGILSISDSGTYSETLSLTPADGEILTIQATDGARPTLRVLGESGDSFAEITVNGGTGDGAGLTLNGLLIGGGLRIEANSLNWLTLKHCTFVPGRGLTSKGTPRRPDLASIVVLPNNDALEVECTACILGPIRMPDEAAGLKISDCIVQSTMTTGEAHRWTTLVSGSLWSFPTLTSPTPTLQIQIGNIGPIEITLADVPMSRGEARDLLRDAIQSADANQAFGDIQIITATNRLIVLPGVSEPVTFSNSVGDLTADELRLTGDAVLVEAFISGDLSPFPILDAASPSLEVSMNNDGPYLISLGSIPTTVAEARTSLHTAIRAAQSTDAFANAIVTRIGQELIVLPGTSDTSVILGTTDDDPTTLFNLELDERRPALASDDVGQFPGPAASIVRSTILGDVFIRSLELGSESIFTSPVVAERRQIGCARYSYFPGGSRTPRRYRCQPDLAVARLSDESEKERTRVRLLPSFAHLRYGNPEYIRLRRLVAEEIRYGSEDGSEMGVYLLLKEALREANLRAALDEYLRFGLEAGLFFIT